MRGSRIQVWALEYNKCNKFKVRPDPIITWWLGDSFIGSAAHISHKVGNITRSVLTLTPRHGDDQRLLTCRAENTQIQDGALQDAWKLTVYCKCDSEITSVLCA